MAARDAAAAPTNAVCPTAVTTASCFLDRRTSNEAGNDYVANAVLFGLRFQR